MKKTNNSSLKYLFSCVIMMLLVAVFSVSAFATEVPPVPVEVEGPAIGAPESDPVVGDEEIEVADPEVPLGNGSEEEIAPPMPIEVEGPAIGAPEAEPVVGGEEIEVADPEVPLDDGNDIPYTGDEGFDKTVVFAAALVLSAVGMIAIAAGGKQKKQR